MKRQIVSAAFPFFLISFSISLLLLIGHIDPDFFSYYYVGRAVIWGRDMFADVAESKGPVTYLFFAALYWLFGQWYAPALVLASTVLDALSSILLVSLLTYWLPWKMPNHQGRRWIVITAIVVFVKSFSINTFQGGIYSEQIGFPLLLFSLFLAEKRKPWIAGIIFAGAILARQSLAGYLIFVCIQLYRQRTFVVSLLRFLIGLGMVVGVFILSVWWSGQLEWVVENMIISVWWYGRTTAAERLPSIMQVINREVRLLLALLLGVFFLIRYWWIIKKKQVLIPALGLLLSGSVSVFAGALVWDHHFLQLAPFFTICLVGIIVFTKDRSGLLSAMSFFMLTVALSYGLYTAMGFRARHRLSDTIAMVPEVAKKRYLVVYGFSPRLYIDYDKEPPDRYYNPDLSLNARYLGAYAQDTLSRHLAMGEEKARNTAFVFFYDERKNNTRRYQWYVDALQEPFHLQKLTEYPLFGSLRMEVYGWQD